jgi:hypothetical protein
MKPIDVFKHGRNRAEHLLKLAELLTNTRKRNMRNDWAKDFKKFMHWKQSEQIDRVDGIGAILILRQSSQLTSKTFGDEYTSELLRAAHVTIVAALDRYCHELIASRFIACLKNKKNLSAELKKIELPIQDVHKAVIHAKKPKSRPLISVRASVQELLYKKTFQSPREIADGLSIIGVKKLWVGCATHMGCNANDITNRLNRVVSRRNRIVHEGDIVRHKKGGKLRHAPITRKQVAAEIIWVGDLIDAIEQSI